METLHTYYEEIKVKSKELADKVRDLIHEGTIRRIIIKDHKGNTFVEIPVAVAAVGAIAAPVLAAVGAIAALVADFTIVVEKVRHDPDPPRTADTTDTTR